MLSLCGGILAAFLTCAAMFTYLHWPYGLTLLLCVFLMIAVFNIFAIIGLNKHEGLNALVAKGVSGAKGFRSAGVVALVAVIILCIAGVFRIMHWPGAGWLVMLGSVILMLMSIVLGYCASLMYQSK